MTETLTNEQLVDAITEKEIGIENAISNLETVIAEKVRLDKELIDVEEAVRKAKFLVRELKSAKRSLERRYWQALKH